MRGNFLFDVCGRVFFHRAVRPFNDITPDKLVSQVGMILSGQCDDYFTGDNKICASSEDIASTSFQRFMDDRRFLGVVLSSNIFNYSVRNYGIMKVKFVSWCFF